MSNLIGFVVFAALVWHGYADGNVTGRDLIIAVGAGFATAWVLGRLTLIIRPLRWLITAALFGALAIGALRPLG